MKWGFFEVFALTPHLFSFLKSEIADIYLCMDSYY